MEPIVETRATPGHKRGRLFQAGKRLRRWVNRIIATHSKVGDPPVFAPELFPWVPVLEQGWPAIKADLEALLAKPDAIPTFHAVSPDQKRISHGTQWRSFFLWGFGYRITGNCERCPDTAAVLEQIPGLVTAFFSILAPGAHIPPHRGVTKRIVNCHLALMVPRQASQPEDRCRMLVDDQVVTWEPGKCVVFDDTYQHAVWNPTQEMRVVLLLQVKRPIRQPGRFLGDLFLWLVRRSPYVQDARRNLARWENAQHKLEKEY